MASISTDKNGNRRVLFKHVDGSRQAVYLGPVPMGVAAKFKQNIERILIAMKTGQSIESATIEWLVGLSDDLHAKLCSHGLAQPRVAATEKGKADAKPMLGDFLREYIDGRTGIKPRTKINLEQAREKLVKYFESEGPRSMDSITPGDADKFRRKIREKLGENTVRRHCGRAKQFFLAAVRDRLIAESPFADMKKTKVKANKKRERFISLDDARKVLDACPDSQWRAIFALCRFGGLRCPSEVLELRISDINWDTETMLVRSPKTEHHDGHEERTVPIFDELEPYLSEAWHQAEPGSVYLISKYRDASSNLRTQFNRIVTKAGLTPWPKPFQNLRSTRETELFRQGRELADVCAIIGNSPAVALEHYLQVSEDLKRGGNKVAGVSATHIPTQQVAEPDCTGPTEKCENAENLVVLGVSGEQEYPYGESNPGFRTENPTSWATRR